jgi:hypothetical protein
MHVQKHASPFPFQESLRVNLSACDQPYSLTPVLSRSIA